MKYFLFVCVSLIFFSCSSEKMTESEQQNDISQSIKRSELLLDQGKNDEALAELDELERRYQNTRQTQVIQRQIRQHNLRNRLRK